MDDYATQKELNGLGERITNMCMQQVRHDEKIKQLEEDVIEEKREVWRAISTLRDGEKALITKVGWIMGGISLAGFVASAAIQIIGG